MSHKISIERASTIFGLCSNCHEQTSLFGSCCGAPVFFEGASYDPQDIEIERLPQNLYEIYLDLFDSGIHLHDLKKALENEPITDKEKTMIFNYAYWLESSTEESLHEPE